MEQIELDATFFYIFSFNLSTENCCCCSLNFFRLLLWLHCCCNSIDILILFEASRYSIETVNLQSRMDVWMFQINVTNYGQDTELTWVLYYTWAKYKKKEEKNTHKHTIYQNITWSYFVLVQFRDVMDIFNTVGIRLWHSCLFMTFNRWKMRKQYFW